jgi:transposase
MNVLVNINKESTFEKILKCVNEGDPLSKVLSNQDISRYQYDKLFNNEERLFVTNIIKQKQGLRMKKRVEEALPKIKMAVDSGVSIRKACKEFKVSKTKYYHYLDEVQNKGVIMINHDPVSRPAYYTDGKIEVIDFIEDKKLGFHLGNAIKYISRAGKKDVLKTKEDLEKAIFYINRHIQTQL